MLSGRYHTTVIQYNSGTRTSFQQYRIWAPRNSTRQRWHQNRGNDDKNMHWVFTTTTAPSKKKEPTKAGVNNSNTVTQELHRGGRPASINNGVKSPAAAVRTTAQKKQGDGDDNDIENGNHDDDDVIQHNKEDNDEDDDDRGEDDETNTGAGKHDSSNPWDPLS